tara:strand:- start:678 stop:1076 length:399 start_codon:yes stop_codon:yes gene_type:complete
MINSNISKKISGKNIKIGKSYSLYCKRKIGEIFKKYSTKVFSYNSRIAKKKYYFKVKLKIVLSKDIDFEATGKAKLPYEALDIALYTLKKILRRHSRRIKYKSKKNREIRYLKESFFIYNDINDGTFSKKVS